MVLRFTSTLQHTLANIRLLFFNTILFVLVYEYNIQPLIREGIGSFYRAWVCWSRGRGCESYGRIFFSKLCFHWKLIWKLSRFSFMSLGWNTSYVFKKLFRAKKRKKLRNKTSQSAFSCSTTNWPYVQKIKKDIRWRCIRIFPSWKYMCCFITYLMSQEIVPNIAFKSMICPQSFHSILRLFWLFFILDDWVSCWWDLWHARKITLCKAGIFLHP